MKDVIVLDAFLSVAWWTLNILIVKYTLNSVRYTSVSGEYMTTLISAFWVAWCQILLYPSRKYKMMLSLVAHWQQFFRVKYLGLGVIEH